MLTDWLTDGQIDGWTFAFLELLSQLKTQNPKGSTKAHLQRSYLNVLLILWHYNIIEISCRIILLQGENEIQTRVKVGNNRREVLDELYNITGKVSFMKNFITFTILREVKTRLKVKVLKVRNFGFIVMVILNFWISLTASANNLFLRKVQNTG